MPRRRSQRANALARNLTRLGLAVFVGAGLAGCNAVFGAETPSPGLICIAPFGAHVPLDPNMPGEANLSTATWPPNASSVFEFRLDGKKVAAIRLGEMVAVRGVALDRPVRLSIKLDGKPFESYPIDLRAEPDNRTCLWLYPGYWRWLNGPWDVKRGCKCEADVP
jgi:hypothetical protein